MDENKYFKGKSRINWRRKQTGKPGIIKSKMQTKQATANHRPDTTGIPTNARKISGETRYIFAQTRTNYESSLRKSRFHAPNNPMYSSNGLFLAQEWNTLLKSVNFKSAIGTGPL